MQALTEYSKTNPVRCPYCEEKTVLVDGSVVYPHRPDLRHKLFYLCRPCSAFVGCHKNMRNRPDVPLGFPAKPRLRNLRTRIHTVFDPIWRENYLSRSQAYAEFSKRLGIPVSDCHISQFMEERAERALVVAQEWREALPNEAPSDVWGAPWNS